MLAYVGVLITPARSLAVARNRGSPAPDGRVGPDGIDLLKRTVDSSNCQCQRNPLGESDAFNRPAGAVRNEPGVAAQNSLFVFDFDLFNVR